MRGEGAKKRTFIVMMVGFEVAEFRNVKEKHFKMADNHRECKRICTIRTRITHTHTHGLILVSHAHTHTQTVDTRSQGALSVVQIGVLRGEAASAARPPSRRGCLMSGVRRRDALVSSRRLRLVLPAGG